MNFDNEAKHVVPKVEDLRTRVQSPPPPPDLKLQANQACNYELLNYCLIPNYQSETKHFLFLRMVDVSFN